MHKLLLSLVFFLTTFAAWAQSFPSQPVHIVVPFPPGGSADVLARILQPRLNELWKQPVLVENKPGASANIGAAHVARSAPDGTTMLLATPALAVSAAVYKNLPYDAQRDLAPVAMLSVFPSVLVVHPSVPAKTPQELVAYAKANPGKLNFASAGNLSAIRFAFEHLAQITGMKAVHVPYKGSAPSAQAMLAGESHTMMMTLVDALPRTASGKVMRRVLRARELGLPEGDLSTLESPSLESPSLESPADETTAETTIVHEQALVDLTAQLGDDQFTQEALKGG